MEEPNCWLCGGPIDLRLPRGHAMSSTVDEVIPRSLHPRGARYAALDRSNCRHAHRACNSRRGNGVSVPFVRRVVRSREW